MIKRISPKILLLALAFISIPQITDAQQSQDVFEYGSLADLKGVKEIYVDTGANIELRNSIIKEITKSLKNIVVTANPSEGEVCLVYNANFQRLYAGTSGNGTVTDKGNTTAIETQSTPQYRNVTYGSGAVVIMKPNNVIRIIMNFNDSKGDKPPLATLFERNPTTNFARAFVKAYKEANKEDKK
jgi:hypothetical protein